MAVPWPELESQENDVIPAEMGTASCCETLGTVVVPTDTLYSTTTPVWDDGTMLIGLCEEAISSGIDQVVPSTV